MTETPDATSDNGFKFEKINENENINIEEKRNLVGSFVWLH